MFQSSESKLKFALISEIEVITYRIINLLDSYLIKILMSYVPMSNRPIYAGVVPSLTIVHYAVIKEAEGR